MHLIVGFFNVMLAHVFGSLYRLVRVDVLGRAAIRRACAAFTAGAGIDDAAIEVIRGMGPDGARLLKSEADRLGQHSVAGMLCSMLQL
jgi:hypothetical protein